MLTSFVERLSRASRVNHSLLCVGLDPDPELMAIPDVFEFNREIVDATKDLVCAFKPNLPFYEALGMTGYVALEQTIRHIRDVAPEVIILGDSKRGDIGSTNAKYAQAMFDVWGFDALTVNAFAGGESLQPFLDYEDRGVFVWCRSSNPGAKEFQDLSISADGNPMALYEWMAYRASTWKGNGDIGLVVGATYPQELTAVRRHCTGMPILIPGVGAQGGDLDIAVRLGLDSDVHNILISSSRGIMYASADAADFGQAARLAATKLRDRINHVLDMEGRSWS